MRLVISLVCALTFAQPLRAGEIYSLNVVPDGSAAPPGDVIEVTAILYPEEKNAQLTVSAYKVSGENNEVQTPINASGNGFADRRGRLEIVDVLRKSGDALNQTKVDGQEGLLRFDRKIAVPYERLKPGVGEHRIGYVVTLHVDGKTKDVAASSLSLMKVTDRERKELVVSVNVPRELQASIEGYIWQENKLKSHAWDEPRIEELPENRVVAVSIPGEFQREKVFAGAPVGAAVSSKDWTPEPRRTIYYATNRDVTDSASRDATKRYGDTSISAVDKMEFGKSVVNVPISAHRPGGLERPGTVWYFWKESPDPKKHFIAGKLLGLSDKDFRKELAPGDLIVYVHGYNNSFEDALLRGAQLQHDLEFSGRMVVFSWPSAGRTLLTVSDPFDGAVGVVKGAYKHDEDAAAVSHPFLAELLQQLLAGASDRDSPRKVHVLAHSMGNRILLKALHELQESMDGSEDGPKLGQVVLAAADINGTDYGNVRDDLFKSCQRVTFYYAPDDLALVLSRTLHVDKPIGMSPVFDKDRMDTISAETLTSVFNRLGHLYVTESRPVLTDLRLLLVRGLPPLQRRPPLGPRREAGDLNGLFYWTFQPYP